MVDMSSFPIVYPHGIPWIDYFLIWNSFYTLYLESITNTGVLFALWIPKLFIFDFFLGHFFSRIPTPNFYQEKKP